jgi:FixJ family two-component response regulator
LVLVLTVVLTTGWGSVELTVAGMKAGAVQFLTKPSSKWMSFPESETVI